jgi:transposase-like protein
MSGLTSCPFCQSRRIRARLPLHDLHEYECEACARTWLVARPKRQAKIVAFPDADARAKRRTAARRGGS